MCWIRVHKNYNILKRNTNIYNKWKDIFGYGLDRLYIKI